MGLASYPVADPAPEDHVLEHESITGVEVVNHFDHLLVLWLVKVAERRLRWISEWQDEFEPKHFVLSGLGENHL